MSEVTKKKRVALYVRVSTTEQVEKYGKDAQITQMKKWLALHDDEFEWSEKHIYVDDGYSGASEVEEREALPKLFEDALKKKFDVLCVWKLDRFFRKTRLLLNAIDELQKIGIGFIATSQSEVNTTQSFGKFMLGLLGIIAEMERDLIMERTSMGRMEAAKQNKFVGGMTTYGYYVRKDTQELKIDPVTSKIVRKIFQWFVKERLTTYEIQKRLNAMKIPTQADIEAKRLAEKGKLKKNSRKRKTNQENYWHHPTISKILKNEAYTGKFYYGKKTTKYDPIRKKKVEIMNPPEEWVPLTCPRIIDDDVFKLAKKYLKDNEKTRKSGSDKYLLSGKLTCGLCGSPYGGYTKKSYKTENGVRKVVSELPHYRCRKENKTKVQTTCKNRQISGSVLEAAVWKHITALLADPKTFLERIEREERQKVDVKELEKRQKVLEKAQKELSDEAKRVVVLFRKGIAYQATGELEREVAKLETDQIKIEYELNTIAGQLMSAEEKRERLAAAKNLAKKYAKSLDKLTYEMKQGIIHDLIQTVVITGEDVDVYLIFPSLAGDRKGGVQGNTPYGATSWN